MLKKRIIPCLDIKDGRVVKGVNFKGIKDAGDPVDLASQYVRQGADELVFLDITATIEGRETLVNLVKAISREINIPFTVGGGITNVAGAKLLISSGADKVSINSGAVKNPHLITDIAKTLGSQAVVVAIDAKFVKNSWEVFANGGRIPTGLELVHWAKYVEQMGAGEILFTSMDNDGAKSGFAIDALSMVCASVSIPVIASGGAGTKQHFADLFINTKAAAGLAASIFHYNELNLTELKSYLKQKNIPIR